MCWVEEVDEFIDEIVEQICVIEFYWYCVFEEGKDGWEMVLDILYMFGFIFLVLYYIVCIGFFIVKLLLFEFVYLVVKYWWFQFFLDSLVDVVCVLILVMIGVDFGDELVIGVCFVVKLFWEVDMKYVEYIGVVIKIVWEQFDLL